MDDTATLKEQMVTLLLSKPSGQIVACNIIASSEEGLVDDDILKVFLKSCLQAYRENPVTDLKRLLRQFEDVARGILPNDEEQRKCFFLQCKECAKSIETEDQFSTTIEVGALKEYLVCDTEVTKGHAAFLSNPGPIDPILTDAINKLNGRPDIYRPGATLGGNSLVWVTRTSLLDDHLNGSASPGDTIRDLLGLVHHKNFVPLTEVCLNGKVLGSYNHARPSCIDAGSNSRFKQIPDMRDGESDWGWTVDLNRLASKESVIDGAPEQVWEPFAFTASAEPIFRFIGGTVIIRGRNEDDNDEAFLIRIKRSLRTADLKKTLLDLLL